MAHYIYISPEKAKRTNRSPRSIYRITQSEGERLICIVMDGYEDEGPRIVDLLNTHEEAKKAAADRFDPPGSSH